MYQFEEMSQWMIKTNEALLGSAIRVGRLAAERQQELLTQQAEVAKKMLAAGNEQMTLAKDAKDPVAYLEKATAAATEFGQEIASLARQTLKFQAQTAVSVLEVWQPVTDLAPGPKTSRKRTPAN